MSVAIFSTERFANSRDVMGVQLKGRARILEDRAGVEEAARNMYGKDQREIDFRTKIDEYLGDSMWKFVKISPQRSMVF